MSDSSNPAHSEISIELLEAILLRECKCMVRSAIWTFVNQAYRNILDTEQIAIDVLEIVIRDFKNHHVLRRMTLTSPLPVEVLGEIRVYYHRVARCLIANEVRNARARKRGLGTFPTSMDIGCEPMVANSDPAANAECADMKVQMRSALSPDQRVVLQYRESNMTNVEIAKKMNLSLRSIVRLRAEIKAIAQTLWTDLSPNQTAKQQNSKLRWRQLVPKKLQILGVVQRLLVIV